MNVAPLRETACRTLDPQHVRFLYFADHPDCAAWHNRISIYQTFLHECLDLIPLYLTGQSLCPYFVFVSVPIFERIRDANAHILNYSVGGADWAFLTIGFAQPLLLH